MYLVRDLVLTVLNLWVLLPQSIWLGTTVMLLLIPFHFVLCLDKCI